MKADHSFPLPRRKFLLGTAATAFAATLPGSVQKAPEVPAAGHASQGGGFYRFKLGEYEVYVVSDGAIHLPTWPTFGGSVADEKSVRAELAPTHEADSQQLLHVNALFLRGNRRIIMVDTGYGPSQTYRPGGGFLQRNLAAAGIDIEQIDTVLITHAHPDHFWGIWDGSRRIFSRARHLMPLAERHSWLISDAEIAARPAAMQRFLRPNRDRMEMFLQFGQWVNPEDEIAPGVRLLPLPGHTPGHVGVEIDSAGQRLVHTSDAIPHSRLHTRHPDWHYGLDSDPAQAAETRNRLLVQLAKEGSLVTGCHFGFPAVGYIVPAGAAFSFLPKTWEWV